MTPDNAKTIMDFLAGCIEQETAATARVISALPDGKHDYQPHDKCMAAGELAWHIATSQQFFMDGIAAGEFTYGAVERPESANSGPGMAAWYQQQTAANLARLRAMTGEQCAKILDFHGMFRMPAVSFAQISLTHAIHHRGQLSAYLRPMGSKVPSIYGPSADEPIAATAKG